jgi:hypothetical protein
MSSELNDRENPDELKTAERALAALVPRPPQVERDRLMFLAGARSQGPGAGGQRPVASGQESSIVAKRGAWLWPAASAVLGATSLALLIALVVRANAPTQIVYVDRPVPAMLPGPRVAVPSERPRQSAPATDIALTPRPALASSVQVPADNYLRSREVALRMGLDALGAPRSGGGSTSAVTYLDWLAGLEGAAPPVGAAPQNSALPQM